MLVTVGSRNEAVECRRLRRGALRPVDAQIAGNLVDLIFHQVEGRDLDIGVEEFRRFRAGGKAVPRMRPELADVDRLRLWI